MQHQLRDIPDDDWEIDPDPSTLDEDWDKE